MTTGSAARSFLRMQRGVVIGLWMLAFAVLLNLVSGGFHLSTALRSGSSFSWVAAGLCAAAVVVFSVVAWVLYRRARRGA